MKNLYVNSRLHPLLIAYRLHPRPWLFSGGEPWLLMTPGRLERLARVLGLVDRRVDRLLDLLRRHSPDQEAYCLQLGLRRTAYVAPAEYPSIVCPCCDNVHRPHPLDANELCRECRDREDRRPRPPGGVMLDREQDRRARLRLREKDPGSFDGDVLSPNHKYNRDRKLDRDWDQAVNRILMGLTYRRVAGEFDCSVGLLHRKVHERKSWEDN